MTIEITRCSLCHEMYENTIDGLTDHYYGDNVYARYHNEISYNQIEVQRTFSGSWLQKLFNFRKPKIIHTALDELLDYKTKLNKALTSGDYTPTVEIKSEQK